MKQTLRLSSKLRHRRRSTPSRLRWLSLLVSLAVIRTIWNSVVFTSRQSAVIGDMDVPRRLPYSSPAPTYYMTTKHQRSRVKLRPRKDASEKNHKGVRWVAPSSSSSSSSSKLEQPQLLSGKLLPSWNDLCRGGQNGRTLSSKSRVLLSGILTHTMAVELAWTLMSQCHVESLVGHSTLPYSSSSNAAAIPPRIAYLLRRLPNFEWIHHDGVLSQQGFDQVVASVRPTHVLHFETTTMPDIETTTHPTILVRQSLDTLDRLGRALVTWQNHEKRQSNPVRLLYVTMPVSRDEHFYLSGAVDSLYPLLLQTFRAHYHLDAIHLQLPYVYGPFAESALPAEALLPFIPGSSQPGNKTVSAADILPHHKRSNLQMAHIDDCIMSLVASFSSPRVKTKELPRFQVPTAFLTTPKKIAALHRHANYEYHNSINDRTRLMLSWYHHSVYPFDESNTVYSNGTKSFFKKTLSLTNRRLESNRPQGISLLEQRKYKLFPCASECAVNSPCRDHSPLAPILPMSQNLTQGCRFVLYTTDFSKSMVDLPALQETIYRENSEIAWPRHLLCRVAFVSGKSVLVQEMMEQEQKDNPGVDVQSLNGQLKHNNWTLLWLPEDDDDTLSEADYLFPKLSPRPFFAHNVTKSIYIQAKRKNFSFPAMPIIWFLLSKNMDAKRQGERVKKIKRSGTSVSHKITLPPAPARHVALFTHALALPQDLIQASSSEMLAKFLLTKVGVSRPSLPLRQLEFYDFAKTQYDWRLPDSFLLIHNMESDRSRRLRCEWYEEHLFWADNDDNNQNRGLEDFSLAYVMGKWRAEQRLVPHQYDNPALDGEWGERIVEVAKGDLTDDEISSMSNTSLELLQPSQYYVRLHSLLKPKDDEGLA